MNLELKGIKKSVKEIKERLHPSEFKILFLEGGKLSDGEVDIPYEDEAELARIIDENFIIELQPPKNVTP